MSGFIPPRARATHSSTLAWKIPRVEEPGRLQSMGSRRVGHDGVTSLSLFTFMHWKRKWQPTPVFLPGESQGQGSLVGCCFRGRIESDRTEQLTLSGFVPGASGGSAAKSLQLCPTLCDPHRQQPTRLPYPWDSPGRNTGMGCHFLLQCMKVKSEREEVRKQI